MNKEKTELDTELLTAYEHLQKELACSTSADEIVCDPDLRNRFLALSHEKGVMAAERDILHRLLNLRKRKRLPRLH